MTAESGGRSASREQWADAVAAARSSRSSRPPDNVRGERTGGVNARCRCLRCERMEGLLPCDAVRGSRFFAWKRASAVAVAAVNRPSTAFGSRPNGISLNSSEETSQPTAPTPSSRWPSSGRPSVPSATRVAGSSRPGPRMPTGAGSLESPRRERPVDPVDGCRVLAVRAQRHLEGGDAGVPAAAPAVSAVPPRRRVVTANSGQPVSRRRSHKSLNCRTYMRGTATTGVESERLSASRAAAAAEGSPGWTRTNNPSVNSRMLCQLSYRGRKRPEVYPGRAVLSRERA